MVGPDTQATWGIFCTGTTPARTSSSVKLEFRAAVAAAALLGHEVVPAARVVREELAGWVASVVEAQVALFDSLGRCSTPP
jgi:hypothetical protein